MCTVLHFSTKDSYFGRTLDLDCSYGEEICIIPRRFPLDFRCGCELRQHYALIGMALVVGDLPLFYDAANEHGLAMAGLNFPENAHYPPHTENKDNITPFEFIPWILGQCKSVPEAKKLLENINLVNIPFSEQLPLSPLHWMIADRNESIVIEAMKSGIHICDNPVGVMTNNPPFEYQLFNLNNYRNLSVDNGENRFSENVQLSSYCQGLGGLGLPGDVSSMSRFVRIAFGRENSVCCEDEISTVSQFFHLLASVSMNRGICRTTSGKWDITVYTSCINIDKGLYYYTTYDNQQISCVNMHNTNLDADFLIRFPLITEQQIRFHN